MADEDFVQNLMRMMAAELHVQNTMTAAREMFGRGYFSLGAGEKLAVDQAVFGFVAANYQAITPQWLATQQVQQQMGFQAQGAKQSEGSS
jgi:hypothetical protein